MLSRVGYPIRLPEDASQFIAEWGDRFQRHGSGALDDPFVVLGSVRGRGVISLIETV